MKTIITKILGTTLLMTFVFGSLPTQVLAERMTSSNYLMESDTVNFGGARSTSGTYTIEDTAGESATGNSSSANTSLSAGFQQANASAATPVTPVTPTGGGGGGGSSSGGPTTIIKPAFPTNVMNFTATVGESSILLDWLYPLDADIVGVKIFRSEKFFPTSLEEGETIFDGDAEQVIDHDVVRGVTYYYTLFARNSKGEYSTGVLTSARIGAPGEGQPKPTDPFKNVPQASVVHPAIEALTLSDFDFIQDGRKIVHERGEVVIDAEKDLTVSLDYKKVPEILKTIAVTLGDPSDSTKVFTFLLRINKEKTAYEATIGSLGRSGKYKLSAIVLDYGNQGMKRINGNLRALVLGSSSEMLYNISKSPTLLGGMIAFLVLAFALIIFLVHRQRAKNLLAGTAATLILVLLFTTVWANSAFAAINPQINYQGKLFTSSGSAVSDGSYSMVFNLYTASSGGSPIWTETLSGGNAVTVTSGLFSVLLGSVSSLSGVDFNQTLYLGVNINGDGEMSPRKKLGAVPAAFVADTLDGLDSSAFLQLNNSGLSDGCLRSTSGVISTSACGGGAGGGSWATTTSSVTGQAINYSLNTTDIVTIGGMATTSAKYWFDPNAQTASLAGAVNITGLTTTGTLLLTGSSTLQNFTGLNSTTTNATSTNFFASTASSTNLFTVLANVGNLLLTGSSTLQNFTGLNSTTTNATSTNFYATTASSTNLFAAGAQVGSLSIGSLSGILKATAGAIGTALVDLASDVTGILGVSNGGTGWSNIQANTVLLGNGSGQIATTTAGTNGQVLAIVNGVPAWVATTSAGTGLTYSGGSFNVDTTQNISNLSNLSSNGFVKTSGGNGALSVDTTTYLPSNQTDFIKLTNYGALALTPSTTIPLWLRSDLYASSSAVIAGSVTANNFVATGTAASIFPYASTTALTTANLFIDNLTGPLQAIGGVVSATSTISSLYGGTGFSSYTTGDLLYASGATTLAKLGIGGNNTCLISNGSVPTWSACGGAGGNGGGSWATTTSSVAGESVNYSLSSSDIVAIGGTSTTSAKFWFDPNAQVASLTGAVSISGLTTMGNLLVSGSSTLQNFTGRNATTTNATSTSFFSTTLAATNFSTGTLCLTGDTCRTTWPSGASSDWAQLTNYSMLTLTPSTTLPVWVRNQFFASSSAVFGGDVTASTFNATSTTATSTIAGGLNVGSGALQYDFSTGITSIDNVNLGALSFDTNAGFVSWADLPVTSAAAVGTPQGYSAQINGNPLLTLYSVSDGAGSVGSLGISVGSTSPYAKLSVWANGTTTGEAFAVMSSASTTLFSVRDNGNVGIGTTSPLASFAINPVAGATNQFIIGSSTRTSFIINNTGRVGIATSTPGQLLSVGGDILGHNIIGSFFAATSTSQASSFPYASTTGFSSAGPTYLATTAGAVGIGTTTPFATLAVNPIAGQASNAFVVGSSTRTSFIINNTGRVGIGTTSPGQLLSVAGDILGHNLIGSFFAATSTSQASSFPYASTTGFSSAGTTYLATTAGAVGIGTTTPFATLAVNPIAGQASNAFVVGSSTATRFIINNTGRVGIGTTSPGQLLSVAGDILGHNIIGSFFNATSTTQASTFPYASTTALTISGTTYFPGNSIFNASGFLGIGTTSPYARLSVVGEVVMANFNATSTTATSTIAGGLNVGNGALQYDLSTGVTSIAAAQLTNLNFDEDAGVVTWTNLPVSNAVAGLVQSYTASLDDNPLLSLYGLSDGSGGVGSMGVAVGTTSPYAKFSVWGTGTGTGKAFTVVNNASTTQFQIQDNGLVGIGTTTPFATLAINPVAGAASNQFVVGSSTRTSFIINNSGKVGINRTSLSDTLNITPDCVGCGISVYDSNGGNISAQLTSDAASGALSIYSGGSLKTLFSGRSDTNSFINNGQNFGIGTTSPYAKLSVVGEVVMSNFNATSTTATSTIAGGLSVGNGALQYDLSTGITSIDNLNLGALSFDTNAGFVSWADLPVTSAAAAGTPQGYSAQINGNPLLTLFSQSDGAGGVGALGVSVGSTSPYAKLSVWGNGTGSGVAFNVVNSASTTVFQILDNGNVGIGTTSPYAPLSVNGLSVFTYASTTALSATTICLTGDTCRTTWPTGGSSALPFTTATTYSTTTSATTTPLWLQGSRFSLFASSTSVFDYASTTGLTISGTTYFPNSSIFNASGLLGIGTTSPYARLSVVGEVVMSNFNATSTTATSTIAGGLSVGNGALQYDLSTGKTSIDNLSINAFSFEPNAGFVSWMDLPVTSSAPAGTIEGYSAQINGNPLLTLHSVSDGAGGVGSLGVSIGSTSPVAKLSVWGNGTGSGVAFNVVNSASTTQLRVQDNGLVGIGTTSPFATLAVNPVAGAASNQFVVGSSTRTSFVINNSGQIGVSTTDFASTDKLKVAHNATTYLSSSYTADYNNTLSLFTTTGGNFFGLTSATDGYNTIRFSDQGNGTNWSFSSNSSAGRDLTIYNPNNRGLNLLYTSGNAYFTDKLGIGTTSPYAALSVAGEVVMSNFNATSTTATSTIAGGLQVGSNVSAIDAVMQYGQDAFAWALGYSATDSSFRIASSTGIGSSTDSFTIVKGGNVGIGSTTPWKTLSVTGTVAMNGLGTTGENSYLCLTASKEVISTTNTCVTSSARFKHDIETLSDDKGLSIINALRPVSFTYNDTEVKRLGFIAEEVNEILPVAVFYEPDGTTPRGINYDNFIPVLTKAIQEQQAQIAELMKKASTTETASVFAIDTAKIADEIATSTTFITKVVTAVRDSIQAAGEWVIAKISTQTLTVGTTAKPSGVTIYDKANGEPYCLNLVNGALIPSKGTCESQPALNFPTPAPYIPDGSSTPVIPGLPATTTPPIVIATSTPATGTTTPSTATTTPVIVVTPPAETASSTPSTASTTPVVAITTETASSTPATP